MHSKPVGNGLGAVKYLAPCVFRAAIGNNRILGLEHDKVAFRYRASDTDKLKTRVLTAEEFNSAASCSTFCLEALSRCGTMVSSAPVCANDWLSCEINWRVSQLTSRRLLTRRTRTP